MSSAVACRRLLDGLPDPFGHQSRRWRRHRFGDGHSTGFRTPERHILRCSETRRFCGYVGARSSQRQFRAREVRAPSTVDRVVGTSYAFAAVKEGGSVITWGSARGGGNSDKVWDQLIDGVRHVVGTKYAFAAVKKDGSVVTWSAARGGGKSDNVKSELTGGVDDVVGTVAAFATMKQDGSVVTWGSPCMAATPTA